MNETSLKCSHLGASAHAWMDGDVLRVVFRGSITAVALRSLKTMISAKHAGMPRVIVADYSRALFVMDGLDLWEMMTSEEPSNLPSVPAALVVGPEMFSAMAGTAVAAGAVCGLLRVVKSDLADALAWARSVQPCC